MQLFVTSAPAPGFSGVFRAKRFWPAKGVMIHVDRDRKDDPPEKEQPAGGPLVIGTDTWEALKGDNRISVRPAGDVEDIAAVSAAMQEARVRIGELEAKLGEVAGERAKALRHVELLEAELKARGWDGTFNAAAPKVGPEDKTPAPAPAGNGGKGKTGK